MKVIREMTVSSMKAAVSDRPGRIAFTMTRFDLLRLAWGAVRAAVQGRPGIAIGTGDLEVVGPPPQSTNAPEEP